MSVQLVCDYCETVVSDEHLALSVPREMLPYPDGDTEMFEFHFCGWDCLRNVANGVQPEEPLEEPVPYVPVDAQPEPGTLTQEDQAFGTTTMHNTPMEQRRENKDVEVPFPGITRDRQPITIRRKS